MIGGSGVAVVQKYAGPRGPEPTSRAVRGGDPASPGSFVARSGANISLLDSMSRKKRRRRGHQLFPRRRTSRRAPTWRCCSPPAASSSTSPITPFGSSPVDLYRLLIELEEDETGWHALVLEAGEDTVVWITASQPLPEAAELEAKAWIDRNG